MVLLAASLIVIAYLPGALLYRLPVANRPRRAALPADERLFWAVMLSATVTTLAALVLAAVEAYTFQRVVGIDAALAALLLAAARGRLRYEPAPASPSAATLMPVAIIALGMYLFFPSSEYVIGGKDPGVYINEGIQLAQHGSIRIHDTTLASVPDAFRGMFLGGDPIGLRTGEHEGTRFMGFFVADRARGEVMGQFPHAFPAWIAIGYALDGLSGARHAVGVWAILGVVAVYFAAARLAGRAPAFIGAALLALNVAEVWYARYPNSEVMQQALLFAGLLAAARAFRDDDGFFAPVAAALLGTLTFVRLDSLIVFVGVYAGMLIVLADGKRIRWPFLAPLAALLAVAAWYYTGTLRAYLAISLAQVGGKLAVALVLLLLVAAGLVVAGVRRRWPRPVEAILRWVPRVLAAALAAAAFYAYFLRQPGGSLAAFDAYSLRTFAWYITPVGLLAAVAGFAALAWTRFWKDPVLLTAGALVSGYFFYKLRITPENFWQARRFLPLILPIACVAIAAAGFAAYRAPWGRPGHTTRAARLRGGVLRLGAPMALLAYIGWSFAAASRPLLLHVEYAGVIPALERLAAGFGDRDLVLFEPRASSDAHVLATPLAYIYSRHVLVFSTAAPDQSEFEDFLVWATGHYERVYLVADGGVRIASPHIRVTPVRTDRFSIPEYESPRNAYPQKARLKPFSLCMYSLQPSAVALPAIDVDVGGYDNAWVSGMFGPETQDGVTYRWLPRQSAVSLPLGGSARAIVLRASDGGRPARAGSAEVRVFLNDRLLGTIVVKGGFTDYRVAIPPEVALEAARGARSALVRFSCTTWVPKALLGSPDNRALGIMLDRVRVE